MRFFWKNNVWFRYGAITGIVFLCLWNANSLLTGKIETMFVAREISEDYLLYRDFIGQQENYFRVLSVPVPSKWMTYTNRHPKVSLVDLVRGPWDTFSLPKMGGHPDKDERKWLSPLEQNFSDTLLDISAIGYVVVPRDDPQNADDFFKDFGKRDVFIRLLDSFSYLERIDIGTKDLVVYRNSGSRPHIYITFEEENLYEHISFEAVSFSFLSPSEYRVVIPREYFLTKDEDMFYIHFAEKYHPGWKVHKGDFSWWRALFDTSYFLDDAFHYENVAGLNSFKLPKNLMEEESFSEITIFFRPQAYLYLGLLLSGFIFALCLGYIFFLLCTFFWRKRQKA